MKGIVLAGNSGKKLYPLTLGLPKQLLPVYDKPLIYYPIETLIEVGIKDILIITEPCTAELFIKNLGDGSRFDARFNYAVQIKPEGIAQSFSIAQDFLSNDSALLIIGDCILFGDQRKKKLRKAIRAAEKSGQATIFVCRDYDPNQYGVVKFDDEGRCEKVEGKSTNPIGYSIIGLYVFPNGVVNYARVVERSERGRLEITSLNQVYLEENKLQVQILGSDFRWFDTNSFDSLLSISNYIQKSQKK